MAFSNAVLGFAIWPLFMLAFLGLRTSNDVVVEAQTSALPRGAHPDLAPFYKPSASGEFSCVDGSGKIPWEQVNDDYCDCQDGSDEPGTSACTNGKFYCANAGHVPQMLQSSRVNDGICDCCDGSDEWDLPSGTCQDDCQVLGEAARIEAEKLLAVHKEGWAKRQQRATEGQQRRERERQELEELKTGLDSAKAVKDEKEKVKEEKEEVERAALDKHNEKVELLREEREALERIEDERRARAYFDQLDTNKDQMLTQDELMADVPTFDADVDGQVTEAEVAMFLPDVGETLSWEEFIEHKWKLIKPLLANNANNQENNQEELGGDGLEAPPPPEEDLEEEDSQRGDQNPEEDLDDLDSDYPDYDEPSSPPQASHDYSFDDDEEEEEEEDIYANEYDDGGEGNDGEESLGDQTMDLDDDEEPEDPKKSMRKYRDNRKNRNKNRRNDVDRSDYDEETKAAVDAADAAREEFNEADRQVRDAEDKINALEKTLEQDFGSDAEYASLRGECFEVSDLEYTYKICPFDYTEQKPKHGGSATRLGSWDEWIFDGERRVGMKYSNGVTCWNGPARSTKVDLLCGAEDKLISASEPGRCEYQMTFETPSACRETPDNLPNQFKHDEL